MISLFRRQTPRTKPRVRSRNHSLGNHRPLGRFQRLFEPLEDRALLSATVGTDLSDYEPAATALISGSGYGVGETISVQILHADGTTGGAGHDAWNVTDGGDGDLDGALDGNFQTSWYVDPDDSVGSTFTLTATGLSSGETASATFTDHEATKSFSIALDGTTVTLTAAITRTASGPHSAIPTAVEAQVSGGTFSGFTGVMSLVSTVGLTSNWALTFNAGCGQIFNYTGVKINLETATLAPGGVQIITAACPAGCDDTAETILGSISGQKFEDHNGNGVQDEGDDGLSGWTIFIDAGAGNGVLDDGEQSTTTADDGTYTLGNLSAGTYKVREVLKPGWTRTTVNPGDVTLTSVTVEISPEDSCTNTVTTVSSANGVDFGNFENYSITVHKFVDINGDGVENGGDGGVAGITINIDVNGDSVPDYTGTTDANGNFEVPDIGPGAVVVTEDFSASAFEWVNVFSSNTSFSGISGEDQETSFGNILCNAGVAKTLGFWANNAEKTLGQILNLNNDLDAGGITNTLYASGAYTSIYGTNDFLTYKAFRSWILGASAKNMQYMLSAQLAAAALNVGSGMASAYTLVTMTDAQVATLGLTAGDYTVVVVDGQNVNVIQIKDIIALANDALLGGDSKDYQGALKTILDSFNNMTNWYDSTLC